jgi:NitT/TauT family transport system substrate-binding protein
MLATQTRRRFLTNLSMAGAGGLFAAPQALAAEGSLETTTVRLPKFSSICVSPQYAAEELLRAEGFTDVRYVDTPASAVAEAIGQDKLDFGLNYAALLLPAIDSSQPVTVLAGVHVGCFELFAKEGIRNVADLKGRTVGLQDWGSTAHVLVALMAANVGLDPPRISAGSRTPLPSRSSSSWRERSTPLWAFRPSRRICARGKSVT